MHSWEYKAITALLVSGIGVFLIAVCTIAVVMHGWGFHTVLALIGCVAGLLLFVKGACSLLDDEYTHIRNREGVKHVKRTRGI